MKTKVFILALFCSIWFGGCNKPDTLFMQVTQDHREITVTTADSLLNSILADLKERQSTMSPADVQSVQNLMDRLQFMKEQSIAIEKYAFSKADKQTLANVLNNRVFSK